MNIIKAVEQNDIEYIKNNIGKFNPNQMGQYDFPLLHRATYLGHLEIIEILIDNGADVNILDSYKETPLLSIIDSNENNWFECIDLLISKGANISEEILIKAVRNETFIDVIRLLLENGADIDFIDSDGGKAINYAYDLGLYNVVELLKDYGAVYDGRVTKYEQILRDANK